MRRILIAVGLATLMVLPATAQTNTNSTPIIGGPAADAWNFITTVGATNWMFAPYGTYDTKAKAWGGGLAAAYKLSDFVVPVLRLDYMSYPKDSLWMPQFNLQLQVPVKVFGALDLYPFTFGGVATTVAGGGNNNGDLVGIIGAGCAVKISKRFDIVGDYERWTGGPFTGNNQIRGGILIKLNP